MDDPREFWSSVQQWERVDLEGHDGWWTFVEHLPSPNHPDLGTVRVADRYGIIRTVRDSTAGALHGPLTDEEQAAHDDLQARQHAYDNREFWRGAGKFVLFVGVVLPIVGLVIGAVGNVGLWGIEKSIRILRDNFLWIALATFLVVRAVLLVRARAWGGQEGREDQTGG